jgi:hypothetical protein
LTHQLFPTTTTLMALVLLQAPGLGPAPVPAPVPAQAQVGILEDFDICKWTPQLLGTELQFYG